MEKMLKDIYPLVTTCYYMLLHVTTATFWDKTLITLLCLIWPFLELSNYPTNPINGTSEQRAISDWYSTLH